MLEHKLREALTALQDVQTLEGEVEVDEGYFDGYVKHRRRGKDRIDRRRKSNRSGKRKCVVVMRERGKNGRSLPVVVSVERDTVAHITCYVHPGTILYADEAKDYNALHAMFQMKRINRSESYAEGEVSTNQAESLFSRLRRAETGMHRHIAGPYFGVYAGENSWREDNRRLSNGEQFLVITAAGLHHPVSRQWKDYWQKRKACSAQ